MGKENSAYGVELYTVSVNHSDCVNVVDWIGNLLGSQADKYWVEAFSESNSEVDAA